MEDGGALNEPGGPGAERLLDGLGGGRRCITGLLRLVKKKHHNLEIQCI